MVLPSSGIITMAQVATELGVSQAGINLNQANVRALAGKPSGAISMSDLRGKSSMSTMTVGQGTSGTTLIRGYSRDAGLPQIGSLSSTTIPPIMRTVTILSWWYDNTSSTSPLLWVTFVGTYPSASYRVTIGTQVFTITGGLSWEGSGVTTVTANLTTAQYNALPSSGTVAVSIALA